MLQVARGFSSHAFTGPEIESAVDIVNHLRVACARVQSAAEQRKRMQSALKEISALQSQVKVLEADSGDHGVQFSKAWGECQATLRSLSSNGFDRVAVFDGVSSVLRRAVGAQFAQLFMLVSAPGGPEVNLLAYSTAGDCLKAFPLDALTAGTVAVSGEPAVIVQHADEFWSNDKDNASDGPVRGKFHVLYHPLVGADGNAYGVLQVRTLA